ncbi:Major facilitator superfamily domain general substrate transporter protein [Rutstroemia sp. NJR-2017a BVV2]|nr:Major facilitator superfamily domain general substrate transporter protein [Rutstroemia sp. NJR-2017a BVV2]
MSNNTTQTTLLQGWTDSPDHRGTMDIVFSCTFTIFICIWSVLCVNIGPYRESTWAKVYRKLKLAGLCILGPDFLLLLTIRQWESARKSCLNFQQRGIRNWSMTHAFYADMGGFVIRTKDGVTWPLDANEIIYLIDEEWIKEPVISTQLVLDKREIDDKNKKNALVRIYAIVQILWFLISCIARGVQRLAITTLELTTIGFIITTIGVSLLWLHKPTDIETRRVIELDVTIAEMYARAGVSHTEIDWYDTPLDFLKPERTYYEVA